MALLLPAGLGAATAGATPAAAAGCATQVRIVGVAADQLNVTGCSVPGEPNLITVSQFNGQIEVRDTGLPLEPVAPCVMDDTIAPPRVVCPERGILTVLVLTGSGDDQVAVLAQGAAFVLTGDGNDRVYSESGGTVLLGGGDDEIQPAAFVDAFGGDGTDTVRYSFSPFGIRVSLDDVANDNGAGNIRSDIENIVGTEQDDILTGSAAGNRITGLGGKDVVDAGGGRDVVEAGTGADTVRGQGGNDSLFGRAGNDTLLGGAGTDTAAGGAGTDTCQAETTTGCP